MCKYSICLHTTEFKIEQKIIIVVSILDVEMN